ncbi:MAG TPA: SRPBCC family protein [Pseudonocardia sp.]|jgi:hypothetical protein|uniref:SRPBCC family protein n=1 Tax=Pseudonocardia sp. TaxID=60912 RepID=UPI002F407375
MGKRQQISSSITIAAKAETVYGMVSDLSRMGEWSPEATGGQWVGGATGPAEGARFKGNNSYGNKKWTTAVTVTEASEPTRFSFANKVGPMTVAVWTYEISPAGDTGCTVRETWTDRRNPVVDVLGKAITGVKDRASHTKSMIDTTLGKLKTSAEAAQ